MDYMSLGIIYKKGMPVVSSRKVAEVFHKSHFHVLRTLKGWNVPESFVKPILDYHRCAEIAGRGEESPGILRVYPDYRADEKDSSDAAKKDAMSSEELRLITASELIAAA